MRTILVLFAPGLFCLCYQICQSRACGGFQFLVPLLEDSNFVVPENTTRRVPLEVVGESSCTLLFKTIFVRQQNQVQPKLSETLCIIRLNTLNTGSCTCERNIGVLHLVCDITIDFDRGRTHLVLESIPTTAVQQKTLFINVTYPTTISDFQITPSQEVEENGTVKVTCIWVNGNPLPRILIRNPKNRTIVSQHPDNQFLNATIFEGNITCSDSGQYRCEAEGTDQYTAVDLKVKCPPRFEEKRNTERDVLLGSNAVFKFDVFSYKNVSSTLEGPIPCYGSDRPEDCSASKTEIKISGGPPHLTLEIKVKNAREDDEGTWRLTVNNGFTDHNYVLVHDTVTFTLHVYSQSPPISPGMSAMIGVVGFLTLVIVVLVLSVVYFRKNSQRKGAIINSTRNSDSQGDPNRVSGHSYEEIPDAASPRQPRCHHHGQGQTSRPVTSQPASSRTNQSADVPAAAPVGPYDSLEMSDMGLRSHYSQLGM